MTKLQRILKNIAELYSGMFANLLHQRVTAFHNISATSYEDDISASLHAYIKRIKQETATNSGTSAQHSVLTEPALTSVAKPLNIITSSDSESATPNPLASHLKQHNGHSELAPPLSEKLKASAWEHTHSAIRLAHQGDFASAKLHAVLANNAIHELGYYLQQADYNTFKLAVKTELLDRL